MILALETERMWAPGARLSLLNPWVLRLPSFSARFHVSQSHVSKRLRHDLILIFIHDIPRPPRSQHFYIQPTLLHDAAHLVHSGDVHRR